MPVSLSTTSREVSDVAKRKYHAKVRVDFERPYGGDASAFMDMMRYDGCVVTGWSFDRDERTGRRLMEVSLVNDRPFSGRWASFGLYLTDEREFAA